MKRGKKRRKRNRRGEAQKQVGQPAEKGEMRPEQEGEIIKT